MVGCGPGGVGPGVRLAGGVGGATDGGAVWLPVFDAAGSNNSAEESEWELPSEPPATRTYPFASSVAVWPERASDIDPVGPKVPVPVSYNSAEDSAADP
jgi:hypothetical protein